MTSRRQVERRLADEAAEAGAAGDHVVRDEVVGAWEDRADDRLALRRLGYPRLRGADVEEDGTGKAHRPQHIRQRIHQAPPQTLQLGRESSGRSATSDGRAVILLAGARC